MSVDLAPQELGFKRPFSHEVTEVLKLSNTNNAHVAFKVKTTAPKQYCVRPNSGVIPPNSAVDVQVLLQAMKEDPPLDAKCRDKFLVQTVVISSADTANVTAIWQNLEKTAKSSIQERKIRVNFLPEGSAPAVNGVAAHENHDEEPPAYSSPSPQFGSPAPQRDDSTVSGDTKPSAVRSAGESAASTVTAATTAASASIASMATAVSNSVPTSGEDIKQQLAEAKAHIAKLTSQMADPQLRQRKVQEASEKMQTMVQQSSETGVPVQIVAGLCLLSFLIAYIFF